MSDGALTAITKPAGDGECDEGWKVHVPADRQRLQFYTQDCYGDFVRLWLTKEQAIFMSDHLKQKASELK